MMDGLGELLGLKMATLVAGLVGSIASLAYMRDLTPAKAGLAVLVGTGCAAYVTPLVMGWMNLTGSSGENAAAFIVGVVGMNLVGALYKGGERIRERGIRIAPTSALDDEDEKGGNGKNE